MKTFIAAMALLAGTASAQAPQTALDFGSWCSDVAHFSADRCLENRPEDRQTYDLYVERIAGYEAALNKRESDRILETERANRMGDVTPDQIRDHSAAAEH